MLQPLPDQQEFEREIRQLFNDGDWTTIGRFLRKDRSIISRAFSPDVPERKNPFFCSLEYLWTFDAMRDDLANQVLAITERERMKWLPPPIVVADPAKATANIGRQFAELIDAELSGKPIDVQLREAMDIKTAAEAKVEEILGRQPWNRLSAVG